MKTLAMPFHLKDLSSRGKVDCSNIIQEKLLKTGKSFYSSVHAFLEIWGHMQEKKWVRQGRPTSTRLQPQFPFFKVRGRGHQVLKKQ